MAYIEDEIQLSVNIRALIQRKGLKQTYLAEQLGVSPQKLNDLLSGRRQIKIMELVKMAEVLQVSIDELCGKER